MTTAPDNQTVLTAIGLANRAPSVHNTQPWRWLLRAGSVHLVADRTRHLAATDPDGRDLLLSCGAALHHLRVAFAALGWQAVVHHLPHEHDPDHLATVQPRPCPPTEDDIALSRAILRRRTDRRRFTSWEVPAAHLDLLVRRAGRAGALLVPVIDSATRWLLTRAIETAARRQADNPDYQTELAAWSRSSFAAQDGVRPGGGTASWRGHECRAAGRHRPGAGHMPAVPAARDHRHPRHHP